MSHIPATLCRNDFALAPRYAIDWDEDYARDCREDHEAEFAAPAVALTAEQRANLDAVEAQEAHYNRWLKQRRDFNSLGHVAYFERYGSYQPAPEVYSAIRNGMGEAA